MTSAIELLERDRLDLAIRVVLELREALSEVGLVAQEPTVRVGTTEKEQRDSEVTVNLKHSGDIVDVIEFHIFRAGKTVAPREETEAWFRASLQDAIAKARGG